MVDALLARAAGPRDRAPAADGRSSRAWLPHETGTDGFFAARLRRRGEREGRDVKVWKFLVLFGGVLAAVGLLVLVALHLEVVPRLVHSRPVVTTPDVRYLTLEAATDPARRTRPGDPDLARATASDGARRLRPRSSPPAPGSPLRSGRGLKVVLSAGPRRGWRAQSRRPQPAAGGDDAAARVVPARPRRARARGRSHARRSSSPRIRRPGAAWRRARWWTWWSPCRRRAAPCACPTCAACRCTRREQEILRAGCVMAPGQVRARRRPSPPTPSSSRNRDPGRRIAKGERIELVAAKR